MAAVDLGHSNPDPVSVIQVTDEDKAKAGLQPADHLRRPSHDRPRLRACTTAGPSWPSSQDDVDQVVSETDHASLADDPTYQKWTKALGDSGVVTLYAAPAAGDYLAGQVDRLQNQLGGLGVATSGGSAFTSSSASTTYHATVPADPNGLDQVLKDFKGAAATVRFTGSGLELATRQRPDSLPVQPRQRPGWGRRPGAARRHRSGDRGRAEVRAGSPTSPTASRRTPVQGSGQQLLHQLGQESGLHVPDDVETLLGSSTAISIGKDFDYEAASMSADGTGVPVAVTVKGDPAAIEKVLQKIRAQGPAAAALDSDSSGDLTAIGPTAGVPPAGAGRWPSGRHRHLPRRDPRCRSRRRRGLRRPRLRSTRSSRSWRRATEQVADNVSPLRAFGFSSWMDGDVARTSLEITTD